MTLDALIILAGALVALLPFLGFPNSWDTVLFFLLGVAIIGLGIVVRRRLPHEKNAGSQRESEAFMENGPKQTHDPL